MEGGITLTCAHANRQATTTSEYVTKEHQKLTAAQHTTKRGESSPHAAAEEAAPRIEPHGRKAGSHKKLSFFAVPKTRFVQRKRVFSPLVHAADQRGKGGREKGREESFVVPRAAAAVVVAKRRLWQVEEEASVAAAAVAAAA